MLMHPLNLMRALSEASAAEMPNTDMAIDLHEEIDVAPLVNRIVIEGVQMEGVFLTLKDESC